MDIREVLNNFYQQDPQIFVYQPDLVIEYLETNFYQTTKEKIQTHQFVSMIRIHNFVHSIYQTNGNRQALTQTLLHLAITYTKENLTPFTYSYMLYIVMAIFEYPSDEITWLNPLDKSFKKHMKTKNPNDLGYGAKHEKIDDFKISHSKLDKFVGDQRIVYIPGNIKTIGDYAFKDCSSVETIIMSDGVKTIGEGAFQGCHKLKYLVLSKQITTFNEHTFEGCYNLSEIPNVSQVQSIGDGAFKESGIKELIFPPKCTYVGNQAFEHCIQLETIKLDKTVEYIGTEAFAKCSSLREVELPFLGNQKKDKDHHYFWLPFGKNATDFSNEISSINHVHIIDASKMRDESFAKCNPIKQITLDKTSTDTIPESAFEGCTNLATITMDSTIKTIAKNAFKNCSQLTELQIETDHIQSINSGAFHGCTSIEHIISSPVLREIGEQAFYGCEKLIDINVPSTVEFIGKEAFGAIHIQQLSLPFLGEKKNVKDHTTKSLVHIFSHRKIDQFPSVEILPNKIVSLPKDLESVIIREEKLFSEAFANCTTLKRVYIDDQTKSIEDGAFKNTQSLEEIIVSEKNHHYLSDDHILIHKASESILVYPQGRNDKEYTIPEKIKKITAFAFSMNGYLEKITLHNDVTHIGEKAFAYMPRLATLELPPNLQYVGLHILEGCVSLQHLTTPTMSPTNQKKTDHRFFDFFGALNDDKKTYSLKQVHILSGELKANMFAEMPTLLSLIIGENVNHIETEILRDTNINAVTILVPLSVLPTDFFTDKTFKELTISSPLSEEEESSSVINQSKIDTLTIYHGIIHREMFAEMDVKTLILGKGVTQIKAAAFKETKLTKLVLLNPTIEIEKRAFIDAFIEKIECDEHARYTFDQNQLIDDQGGLLYLSASEGEIMTFPNYVTTIYGGAIGQAYESQRIVFHQNIIKVEKDAIINCPFIHGIEIKNELSAFEAGFMPANQITELMIDSTILKDKLHQLFLNVKSIRIGHQTNYIGAFVFSNLPQLEEIVLGKNITFLGDYVFANCENLKELHIPKTVKHIGFGAFSNCTNIKNLTMPMINPLSILKAIDLTVTFGTFFDISPSDFHQKITQQIGEASYKTYYVPKSLEYVHITGGYFAKGFFSGCGDIQSILIEEYQGDIEAYTFQECKQIKSFTISPTTKVIDAYAFEQCVNLTTINGLNYVENIHEKALLHCNAINTLSFGKKIKNIPLSVLRGCTQLEEIVVDQDNDVYKVKHDGLVEKNNDKFIYYPSKHPKEEIVLSDVQSVGSNAFSENNIIKSITCAGKVKTIEDFAFANIQSLESLGVDQSIIRLGKKIVAGCENIASITLPFIGSKDNYNENLQLIDYFSQISDASKVKNVTVLGGLLHKHSFDQLTQLQTVNLQVKESIPEALFKDHKSLQAVQLGMDVKEIGRAAFAGCEALQTINLSSVQKVHEEAFKECGDLTNIFFGNIVEIGQEAFSLCHELTNIELPNTIIKINQSAFQGCQQLTDVKIQASLEEMGSHVFYDCDEITSLDLPFIGRDVQTPESLTYLVNHFDKLEAVRVMHGKLSANVFAGLRNIKEIALNVGFDEIPAYAFYQCEQLQTVQLPSTVKTIEDFAFAECRSMTYITLPSELKTIGANVFADCVSLEEMNIPNSVEIIKEQAFLNCSKLTSIQLHNGMKSIGIECLKGCTNIKRLSLPFLGNSFDGDQQTLNYLFEIPSKQLEFVSIFSGELGESACKEYQSLEAIVLPQMLQKIPDSSFENCISLQEIIIPSQVEEIGPNAFKGCKSLSIIEGLDWVDHFGESSFAYCESLAEVHLSKMLKEIPIRCFEGCKKLATVFVNQVLEIIMDNAFQDCESLEDIQIPKTLQEIKSYAFLGCKALKEIDLESLEMVEDYAFLDCSKELTLVVRDEEQVEKWGVFWANRKHQAKDEKHLFKKLSNQFKKHHKVKGLK